MKESLDELDFKFEKNKGFSSERKFIVRVRVAISSIRKIEDNGKMICKEESPF